MEKGQSYNEAKRNGLIKMDLIPLGFGTFRCDKYFWDYDKESVDFILREEIPNPKMYTEPFVGSAYLGNKKRKR